MIQLHHYACVAFGILMASVAIHAGNYQGIPTVQSDFCACASECAAFGDPHVARMNNYQNKISCVAGATVDLLTAFGMSVEVTCMGSDTDDEKGWIQTIHLISPNGETMEFSAEECEEFENSNSRLRKSKSWTKLYKTTELFNPDSLASIDVRVVCSKRPGIRADNNATGQIQNTALGIHLKLKDYSDSADTASTSNVGILSDFISNGVTGACLPFTSSDALVVRKLSRSQRKTRCKIGAGTSSLSYDTCSFDTTCNNRDCKQCFPDDENDSKECHYCIKSTSDEECNEDTDCCSGKCNDGTCEAETSSDQIPPPCCDAANTCHVSNITTNTGYCSSCVKAGDSCSSTEDCCSGNSCTNGKCVPPNIKTCECAATCAVVADPVGRSFSWYTKNLGKTENLLYSDSTYNSGNGLEVTYDSVTNTETGGLWVTAVRVNGNLIADTTSCPVYALRQLPRCSKKNCPQKRDKLSITDYNEQAAVKISGVWPFTTENNLNIEIHCVSKRRIRTGIAGHEYTRLDVYLNKGTKFVSGNTDIASDDTSSNQFMINEISRGAAGSCMEPFTSSTASDFADLASEEEISGWVKSNKIDPGECTCSMLSDSI